MANVKVFQKLVKVPGQGYIVKKIWYHAKVLVTSNTHVEYENHLFLLVRQLWARTEG